MWPKQEAGKEIRGTWMGTLIHALEKRVIERENSVCNNSVSPRLNP